MARDQRYDAILMDCEMPEMNGFEATRLIRKLQGQNNSPLLIIGLSGLVMGEEARDCFVECGMDDFLSKPVSPDQLRGKLKAILL